MTKSEQARADALADAETLLMNRDLASWGTRFRESVAELEEWAHFTLADLRDQRDVAILGGDPGL